MVWKKSGKSLEFCSQKSVRTLEYEHTSLLSVHRLRLISRILLDVY